MNRLFILLVCLFPVWSYASEAVSLDSAPVDIYDQASLQRGARLYVDYCQGCHSLKYMRYSRLARDIGLSEAVVHKELQHGVGNIGDTMRTAMSKEAGEAAFGVAPPDLSLTARSRGADWLYTYLRAFYQDTSRPTGVNNLIFKDVAMPNVLGELQGLRTRGKNATDVDDLEQAQPGRMKEGEFDEAVGDLTNFLAYAAEPAKLERSRLGKYVLLYLVILLVVLYKLKKAYWRDVH